MTRCGTTPAENGVARVTVDGIPFGRAMHPDKARRAAAWLEELVLDGLLTRPERVEGPAGAPPAVAPYVPPKAEPDPVGVRECERILEQLRGRTG